MVGEGVGIKKKKKKKKLGGKCRKIQKLFLVVNLRLMLPNPDVGCNYNSEPPFPSQLLRLRLPSLFSSSLFPPLFVPSTLIPHSPNSTIPFFMPFNFLFGQTKSSNQVNPTWISFTSPVRTVLLDQTKKSDSFYYYYFWTWPESIRVNLGPRWPIVWVGSGQVTYLNNFANNSTTLVTFFFCI